MARLLSMFLLICLPAIVFSQTFFLFVGTYTDKGSKGIYVYTFDAASGEAKWLSNTEGLINPSYLAIAPNKKFIYAVTETAMANAGSISAFAFDTAAGKLKFLNKQSSGGDNPCYVSVDIANKWLTIANYAGGSLSVFPVNDDGSLQPFAQNIRHSGSSINQNRQEKPHVHSTVFSPDFRYLFASDLGIDKIKVYRFKGANGMPLNPLAKADVYVKPGSGPRHLTFHPNGRYAYLVEEISGTVSGYRYRNGKLLFLQRLALHPFGYSGTPGSADIHLSPDGKFLYASNRGTENNIAMFAVNSGTGLLSSIGYTPTLGKVPRNFIIDPTGNYLLVANQGSDNITIFKRDVLTGALTNTGKQVQVPTPVCLQMMRKD